MPADQTEAIVFRTSPFGEIDRLVVFFSRDYGLMKGIAKGARKFGNRFGSSLEPMSVVRVFFYEKEQQDLVTITACDLLESFFEIQKEPPTAFLLSYFVELIEEFVPSRAKEELVYRLLYSVLSSLKQKKPEAIIAGYFEAWFLRLNGYLPDFTKCKLCRKSISGGYLAPRKDGALCPECATVNKEFIPAEIVSFLNWVKKNPPSEQSSSIFSAAFIQEVRKVLQSIIIFHLEKHPKSLQFLKQ